VPTKKQRRRRAKDRRHEYEYVYVDDEGREVEALDEPEPTTAPKRDGARGSRRAGPARTIQPPSWRRVGKRALIFAPLMFLTVMLLAPDDASLVANLAQTLFLLLIFLPFSYVMDSVTYRIWRRRMGQTDSGAAGRG
jgi:hypothetical protein